MRMMTLKTLLFPLLLLALGASAAGAASLAIDFNDFSAQAELGLPITEDDYGSSQTSFRFLYNDDQDTALGSLGFDFMGQPGNVPGLEVGAAAQVAGGEADDSQDFLNLGVGVKLGYAPPVLGGFGLSGRIFYSPEIFSWLDSDRMVEWGTRASFAVTPKVRLHLDYQNVRNDFEDHGTWTIDDAVRLGFEARF
ncbi:hypothetical protein DESUT3_00320 [Desulfuromonas versatilis]|uniref:YfaZ n=1 Tax=Desulfuromonas versatilis TaxID=2802975 RepID=A0ABN6DRV3_9BACT|nr:YfaZ family outer membrane protein [Desulfuromonas versatilis]BCR02963.1 hypothetical protein DESUT3_00320 [Desulfuromonas versatilis]